MAQESFSSSKSVGHAVSRIIVAISSTRSLISSWPNAHKSASEMMICPGMSKEKLGEVDGGEEGDVVGLPVGGGCVGEVEGASVGPVLGEL